MRPRQWTKNLAVFVALIFAQGFTDWSLLMISVSAFVVFCVLCGGIYILNDLVDIESDRRHPLKCKRPIASGSLGVGLSRWISIGTISVSTLGAFAISQLFGLVAVGYVALQIVYTFRLKHEVIIDTFCIAGSFFLRVIGGACAISVQVSPWLLVCTFFLSLFLALSKRRHEVVLLQGSAQEHRKVLRKYSVSLLDQMISVVTAGAVVSYSVYTLSPETVTRFGTTNLVYTIPFVLYGVYRYFYLVHMKQQGGSPETALLTDKPLLINIILYSIVVAIVLYK